VTPEPNYRLRLVYSDDRIVVIDFTPIIQQGGVFAVLADFEVFSQVKLGQGGRYIEWLGELDFCADALWLEAHPNDNPLNVTASRY
jgi:NAD dependent epimerase/dehydratase family enzyme